MIILSVDKQMEIFFLSVLLGICAGAAYDLIKIIRLVIPHNKIVTEVEDGIYWIGSAFFLFSYMLKNNSGELRIFSVAAFFAAMMIYGATVSRVIMKLSGKIIFAVKKLLCLFLEIILTPVRLIYIVMKPYVKFCKNKVKKRGHTVLILTKKYAKIKVITIRERMRLIRK